MSNPIIASFVALVAGFAVGKFSSSSAPPPAIAAIAPRSDDGTAQYLAAQNQELEMKIKELQSAAHNCDVVAMVEESRASTKAQAAQRAEEREKEAAKITQAKEALLKNARNGNLTESMWHSLILGQSKATVVGLIGQPDSTRKPADAHGILVEFWSYTSKVLLEESSSKGNLVLQFDGDVVSKIIVKR